MACKTVKLQEIDIEVCDAWCCGQREWYAKLPDGKLCCEFAEHSTRDAAINCAKLRIAKGISIPIQVASNG